MLYVDGVSSIASIEFEMEKWGVDLAVSGSQKGFMLPAGLGILGVSEKALEANRALAGRWHGAVLFQLRGHDQAERYRLFPLHARDPASAGPALFARLCCWRPGWKASGRGITGWRAACAPPWRRGTGARWWRPGRNGQSDTVSAIYAPDGVDARDVISGAYYKYQTSLGTGLNKLMGRAFRIGHLGSLNPVMLCGAISAAEMALVDAGAQIVPGSGVAAAQAHFRETTPAAVAMPAKAA